MSNTKIMFAVAGRDFMRVRAADVRLEFAIDRFQKAVDLRGRALGFQLDRAIRQIANVTGNVKALGEFGGNHAKTDALHASMKNYMFAHRIATEIVGHLS